MWIRNTTLFVSVLWCTIAIGATNTPHKAGTTVLVTTAAGTVKGVLQDLETPQWIAVLEADKSQPTYLQATGVIVRVDSGAEERAPLAARALRPILRNGKIKVPAEVWRDRAARSEHYLFGQPRPTDNRHRFQPEDESEEVKGITVLRRKGFTLGHYDQMKVPAWVAMRWTHADFDESEKVNLKRGDFVSDEELPEYARATKDYFAKTTGYQRGHMARDADVEAWGMEGVREAMRMSNVVPQRADANHRVWGLLEDEHRHIVHSDVNIETVWVISGPVFRWDEEKKDDGFLRKIANGVGVPQATYKVIAWKDENDNLDARAFIIRQGAKSVALEGYLEKIDTVEEDTGLDFFPELSDELETELEAADHTDLWGEFPEEDS